MQWSAADYITIVRFILGIGAAFSLWVTEGNILFPILLSGAVFLTDYADGIVARFLQKTSWRGALLDVTADFCYILLMYLVLVLQGHIFVWFLLVIVFKYAEFLFTSRCMSLIKGKIGTVSDPLGRIVAGWFYISPVIIILAHYYQFTLYTYFVREMVYVSSAVAVLSTIFRVNRLLNEKKNCRSHSRMEE